VVITTGDISYEVIPGSMLDISIVDRRGRSGMLWDKKSGRIYKVKILSWNNEKNEVVCDVNGRVVYLKYLPHYEVGSGFSDTQKREAKTVNVSANISGTVKRILVKEGDRVWEGTYLLTIEAMKMENIITSVASGVVKKINVRPEQKVNSGDLLMIIDRE